MSGASPGCGTGPVLILQFMSHKNPNETRSERWRRILVHEFFGTSSTSPSSRLFLVAFAWYRRLILATYHIQYTGYWAPLVEAAILAKVIMIGMPLRVGAMRHWPLAIPTILSGPLPSAFLWLCSQLWEHVLGALWHGKPASEAFPELANTGWPGFLAWWVLINAALDPSSRLRRSVRVRGGQGSRIIPQVPGESRSLLVRPLQPISGIAFMNPPSEPAPAPAPRGYLRTSGPRLPAGPSKTIPTP